MCLRISLFALTNTNNSLLQQGTSPPSLSHWWDGTKPRRPPTQTSQSWGGRRPPNYSCRDKGTRGKVIPAAFSLQSNWFHPKTFAFHPTAPLTPPARTMVEWTKVACQLGWVWPVAREGDDPEGFWGARVESPSEKRSGAEAKGK
jgi:hypothetical protein